jgi:oligosaccharide reducing-end xylanase
VSHPPLFPLALVSCAAPGPRDTARPPLAGKPVVERNLFQRNLFREIGLSDREIDDKVNRAIRNFFYGDESLRCYYPVERDEAYIYDSGHDNVCSEGMSYGMMIAVQSGLQVEFDRLWNFAARRMRRSSGDWAGYFAWQVHTDGTILDAPPASDGEEWIAAALYFAWQRWGDPAYKAAADDVLRHMLHQDRYVDPERGVTRMIDPGTRLVVFVPYGTAATFTDPSYHLPAFAELWSRWVDEDRGEWKHVAAASRRLLAAAAHPETGLCPDYCAFDGSPCDPTGRGHESFRNDAWRVMQNLAVDCCWFGGTPEELAVIARLHSFFDGQGLSTYGDGFTLDGQSRLSPHHSPGLVAMNAVGALVSPHPRALDFVRDLWQVQPVTGRWRYYDGCLYVMGLLHCAGRFQAIGLEGKERSE